MKDNWQGGISYVLVAFGCFFIYIHLKSLHWMGADNIMNSDDRRFCGSLYTYERYVWAYVYRERHMKGIRICRFGLLWILSWIYIKLTSYYIYSVTHNDHNRLLLLLFFSIFHLRLFFALSFSMCKYRKRHSLELILVKQINKLYEWISM